MQMQEGVPMSNIITLSAASRPTALYLEEADIVEYVRRDVPVVHRRIDDVLTIVLDIDTRMPVGFALKGFKNLYLSHFGENDADFVLVASLLEKCATVVGEKLFDEGRRSAYAQAKQMATEDGVELHDLPKVA
jgi:hypothetical protein